jgi:hypothetical protein
MTVRATKATNFRPDGATTLEQEFAAYGYPSWFYWVVRVVKPALAVAVLVGLVWEPGLLVGASGILVLMIGAVFSHIKVKDPLHKSVPSLTLGFLCICMLVAHFTSNVESTHADAKHLLLQFPASFATPTIRYVLVFGFSAAFLPMLASSILPGLEDEFLWRGSLCMAVAAVVLAYTGHSDYAEGVAVIIQAVVALVPFSVMTVRAEQETPFRPPGAKNLEDEFQAYGYPSWFCKVFRVVKASVALVVAVGIVWTPATVAGASGILLFMIAAVLSHIKVQDPPQKSVPSGTLLLMCIVLLMAYHGTWGGHADDFIATNGVHPTSFLVVLATTSARRAIAGGIFGVCFMMLTHMGASISGVLSTSEKSAPLLDA